MSRYFILLLMVIWFSGNCQEDGAPAHKDPITTDRPDQTETPALVPAGMFQVEVGFAFEKDRETESITTPNALWKYGVNENFELRLITEFASVKNRDSTFSGLAPILVGFKAKLAEEKGIWPQTSIIAHLQVPDLASKNFKADHYAALFRFTMQHSLSEKLSLSYNLGGEWDGIAPNATFIYTLASGISLTENLGCFIELYGFAPEEESARHSFDAGFTYLLSDNFMIDTSAGFGITQNAPDYFLSAGFSFRL